MLSGIHPVKLRQLEATLSLAYRRLLDPDHILYGLLNGLSDALQERKRSRRSFVPAARNLSNNLVSALLSGRTIDETWSTARIHHDSVFS